MYTYTHTQVVKYLRTPSRRSRWASVVPALLTKPYKLLEAGAHRLRRGGVVYRGNAEPNYGVLSIRKWWSLARCGVASRFNMESQHSSSISDGE
jgi:hypothetical protein